MDELQKTFKIIAYLMRYPTEMVAARLPDVLTLVEEAAASVGRPACRNVIRHLTDTPLRTAQETYAKTFDFHPGTTLNLTFHLYGEAKMRGSEMAALKGVYIENGYEPAGGELPDFLPALLELFSLCPRATTEMILGRYRGALETLATELESGSSPYAGLIHSILKVTESKE